MIAFNDPKLIKISIHKVGNKTLDEGITFSKRGQNIHSEIIFYQHLKQKSLKIFLMTQI